MGLLGDLGDGPVAVDTAIFIYFIEEDPKRLRVLLPLFEQADQGRRRIITSALTLLEVLVMAYRSSDRRLAEQYEQILSNSRGVRLVAITNEQLKAAAQIRAATRLKTPDALQLSAAIAMGCRVFLTNDRQLPGVAGIRILQLDSYAS